MTQYTHAPEYTGGYQSQPTTFLRSPRRLGQVVVGGLLTLAGLELVARLLSLHAFGLLRGAAAAGQFDKAGNPEHPVATVEVVFSVLLTLLGWIPVGVLFICWLWRVSNNLGRDGRRWQPGWAIGSWFVPFGALFLPLLHVAEVDRLSDERAAVIDNRPPARARSVVLALWWVGFLVDRIAYPGVIGAVVASGMAGGSTDPVQAWLVVIAVNAAALLIVAGTAVTAAVLVRRISANQERILAAYPSYVVR